MSAILQKRYISEQDYLIQEAENEFKHEYVDGDCYTMSGAGEKHNRIVLNIAIPLRLAARGGRCGVYASDMKCRVDNGRIYYYPDVTLACDPNDNAEYYKERPCLIAEVQSKSTDRIDRHEKWLAYQKIPSLRYYLMADSRQKKVEYFRRDEAEAWTSGVLQEGQCLDVVCADYHAVLTLADIYEDVAF